MVDLTGYKLTFDDEFNTRSISQTGAGTTYGDIRPQWRFDANSDIGFGKSSFVDSGSGYDPFSVQNGALSITAVPDRTASGYPGSWESGLISTQNSFSQTYGYFEVRADFSNRAGSWDAFWMLPSQQTPDPNKAGGWQELDVVEHYGVNDAGVYSTIHTTDPQNGIPWQDNRQVYSETSNPSGFHTYGVNWQQDRLGFYVDGRLTGSQATPSDMHNPMYMLVDLATQDGTSSNPITSQIDYIRAYSKDPNAVAVTQGTVSSPDGQDPGLYGAQAAAKTSGATAVSSPSTANTAQTSTAQTSTAQTSTAQASTAQTSTAQASTAGSASDTKGTAGSVQGSTSPSTSTNAATSSTSGTQGMANTASGGSTAPLTAAQSTKGSTSAVVDQTAPGSSSASAGSGTTTAPVVGQASPTPSSSTGPSPASTDTTSGSTVNAAPAHPTAIADGMAHTVEASPSPAGSSAVSSSLGVTPATASSPAAVSPAPASSLAPSGTAGTAVNAAAPVAASAKVAAPATTFGSGAAPSPSTPNVVNAPAPVASAPTNFVNNAAGASSTPAKGFTYQTFTASDKEKAAALSMGKKVVRYATQHPESIGAANRVLEMLMHYW